MKRRDLVNLSNGIYRVTDGIYDYVLEKTTCDNEPMYTINYGYNSVSLFQTVNTEDYGYEYPTLCACVSIGGLFVQSSKCFAMLYQLKFVPRGSFKEFVKRTN